MNALAHQHPRRRSGCATCRAVAVVALLASAAGLWFAAVIANRPPRIQVPAPEPMPVPNARDYLLRATEVARTLQHKSPLSVPAGQTPRGRFTLTYLRAMHDEARPAVSLVRRGLAHEFRQPAVRSFAAPFPEYARYRELARTLVGAAAYPARDGRRAEASDLLLDTAEVGAAIPRGGSIIAYLVGEAVTAIGLSHLEEQLPHLDADELAHVARRLDRISARRTPYADAVMEEGWSCTAAMQDELAKASDLGQQVQAAWALAGGNGTSPGNRAAGAWRTARFVLANKGAMLRENLRFYTAVARECRAPYTGPSRVPVPRNLLADMGIDVVAGARKKHVASAATLELLRTEVAVARFRLARGRYPARLSELTPRYLASVPQDPFGGAPLRYTVVPSRTGYSLYSLGPNLRDDGALPGRYPGDAGSYDIVATRLWPGRKPL